MIPRLLCRFASSSSKKGSSKQWLSRQAKDPFVKAAAQQDLRARSAFKLMEIQEKYKIMKSKHVIVDLGAAPGSWSEYVSRLQRAHNNDNANNTNNARLVAVDLLPMAAVSGCEFVQGDFTTVAIQKSVMTLTGGRVDVILSDMLGNTSGTGADHYRSVELAQDVLEFVDVALRPGGSCVIKYLQGSDEAELLKEARSRFVSVKIVKPAASRKQSKEAYLVMTSAKGHPPFCG